MIAAPPEKVYAAFVDADALAAWLPPAGKSGRFGRFDLPPGGSYRMVLTYADPATSRGKTTANSDVVEGSVFGWKSAANRSFEVPAIVRDYPRFPAVTCPADAR